MVIVTISILALAIVFLLKRDFVYPEKHSLFSYRIHNFILPFIEMNHKSSWRNDICFFLQSFIPSLQKKSWQQALMSTDTHLRKQAIQICLSPLALWPIFLFAILSQSVKGLWIVSLAIILQLIFNLWKKSGSLDFRFLFTFGLSLFLFESCVQLSSQVFMGAHEVPGIFFLSQADILNITILFITAFAVTLFLQLEFLFFVLSLIFLMSGILAFNNALAMISGEIMAMFVLFIFKARGRQELLFYSVLGAVLSLLYFLLMLFFKYEILGLDPGASLQSQGRLIVLISYFLSFYFIWTGLTLVLGHFIFTSIAAKNKTS